MGLKIIYFIKLSLIVILSVVILGSVEGAPDQPVLFTFAFAVCILGIRFLWSSAMRDEKMIKKRLRISRRTLRISPKIKRAA